MIFISVAAFAYRPFGSVCREIEEHNDAQLITPKFQSVYYKTAIVFELIMKHS